MAGGGVGDLPIMTIMTHRIVLQGQAWNWFKGATCFPRQPRRPCWSPAARGARTAPVAMLLWLTANYVLALAAAFLCAFRGNFPELGPASPNVTNTPATAPPGSPRTPRKNDQSHDVLEAPSR